MAMACAAFCIPTSITTVRLCFSPTLISLERSDEHAIAKRINAVTQNPRIPIFARIVL